MLVPNGQNTHLIFRRNKLVKCKVTRLAKRNHEFAEFTFRSPSDKRVRTQCFYGAAYGPCRRKACLCIVLGDMAKEPL